MSDRYRVFRKFVSEIFERKREPLGEMRCVLNCFRQIRENSAHFAIALQMALGILGQQFSRDIEMCVFANAGENIQDFASVRLGILHTVCSEER